MWKSICVCLSFFLSKVVSLFGNWIWFSLFNTSLWPTLPYPHFLSPALPTAPLLPRSAFFVAARGLISAVYRPPVFTWPLSRPVLSLGFSLLSSFTSLSTCQCVKTQVGSVSPFWILNKYLKLRLEWCSCGCVLLKRPEGFWHGWGLEEVWRGGGVALFMQLPQRRRDRERIRYLRGEGQKWGSRVLQGPTGVLGPL